MTKFIEVLENIDTGDIIVNLINELPKPDDMYADYYSTYFTPDQFIQLYDKSSRIVGLFLKQGELH